MAKNIVTTATGKQINIADIKAKQPNATPIQKKNNLTTQPATQQKNIVSNNTVSKVKAFTPSSDPIPQAIKTEETEEVITPRKKKE